MPAVGKMDKLPDPIKAAFNKMLRANRYGNYAELTQWLNAHGYQISRATVSDYGLKAKKKAKDIEDTAQYTAALVEALKDKGNNIGLALNALAQQKALEFILDHDFEMPDDAASGDANGVLIELLKVIPRLSQGYVQQDKWRKELAKDLKKLEEQAEKDLKAGVISSDGKPTLDPATIRFIRDMYGF